MTGRGAGRCPGPPRLKQHADLSIFYVVRVLSLFVAGAVSLAVLAPGGVGAAESAQRRKERQAAIATQLRTLREQVSEASGEEAELLDRLDEVTTERRRLDKRVAAVDRQLVAGAAEARAAEAHLDEIQGQYVHVQTELALVGDRLAVERKVLQRRAISAYMGRPTTTPAEVMLRARSLREVAATVGYQDAIVHAQRRAVDRYAVNRNTAARLEGALGQKKDAAMAQRGVVIARQAELEGLRAEQDAVRQEARAQEASQQALVAEAHSRVSEFEAQIAALRAESGTITSLLRGLQAGHRLPSGGKGVLSSPLPGAPLSSDFGHRVHPVLGSSRMHDGVDFSARAGTPIRAAATGTVVFAGPRGGYGYATVIDHGSSLATLYAHQSVLNVAEGMQVAAGQIIGAVGSTGLSTGPHLHFEARVAGVPVDPLLYL